MTGMLLKPTPAVPTDASTRLSGSKKARVKLGSGFKGLMI